VHVQAYDFVARHARDARHADDGAAVAVLEIGSLDVNGSVRPLFPHAARYHGIDIAPGPGVDEVADAADWRCDGAFDVVVSTEVLEHAPRWRDVLENAWAALVPGGRLLMTCATEPRPPHSAVDGWDVREGEWYENVGVANLLAVVQAWRPKRWLVEVARDRGDLYLRADRHG
jgi:SAM-dependent methyltransferase